MMLMMAKIEELQAIHNTTISIMIRYSSHKVRQKYFWQWTDISTKSHLLEVNHKHFSPSKNNYKIQLDERMEEFPQQA